MSVAGRKQRNTVDFFPHYVRDSKTKSILKNKFGLAGYAVWFQLLEVLCKSKEHYFNCQDEWDYEWLLSEIGTDKETFEEIMKFLIRFEKIDPELWEHKIIWCQNLVDNLVIVYRKRVLEIPSKPAFLIPKSPEKPISAPEIDKTAPEKPISDNFSPLEKSRVYKSRKEKSKKTYAENSIEFQLAEFCVSEILKNHPHLDFDKAEKQKFCDMFNKLITIDHKTESEIKKAINFATHHQGNNGFCWRDQFQSPLKLRRKNSDNIKFVDYWIGIANKKQSTKGYHSAEQEENIYDDL